MRQLALRMSVVGCAALLSFCAAEEKKAPGALPASGAEGGAVEPGSANDSADAGAPLGVPSDGAAPTVVNDHPCFTNAITAPPAALELDAFYKKYLDVAGVPVVSSAVATDLALRRACFIATKMFAKRADVVAQMVAHRARIAVMAKTELTTDIPEHSDLNTAYPDTNWDTRARGLGGTVARPATSCAEENLVCDPSDPYKGENILVHELAHGMVNLGVAFLDKTFQSRLASAYANAMNAGKWENTYAASNADEYFAEGVQSWFATNLEATPANGIHNDVNTRAELLAYDPALHALVGELFTDEAWTPGCP